jgi:pyridoxal phosphate enzyme (YggS family)
VTDRRGELAAAVAAVRGRIAVACSAAGRDLSDVTLIAVTKTWPASDAELLVELGITDLAENRDAEARSKALAVPGAHWHFVGAVQTNKARSVASYADVVHSVDRASLCDALAEGALRAGRTVDALLQVSLDGDPRRAGVPAAGLLALADRVAGAAGLELRGIMAVAPLDVSPAEAFDRLAELTLSLREQHPGADLVSAGMSGDLEAAIVAGATHVRVGTAILGGRRGALR